MKLDKVRYTFHKLLPEIQARLVMIFNAAQSLSTKICLTARNIATCGENLKTHFVHDIFYLNAAVFHIAQEYLVSIPRWQSVSIFCTLILTLNLLTTTIVAPPSNASKWPMGFNSRFKGLILLIILLILYILYIKINIFNFLVFIPMTPIVNAFLYFYFPVLCLAVFFKPSVDISYPSLSKPVWFKPAKSCNSYYVLQILGRCIQN